jgi:N-acetylmuramoyl-L-alanine amidase
MREVAVMTTQQMSQWRSAAGPRLAGLAGVALALVACSSATSAANSDPAVATPVYSATAATAVATTSTHPGILHGDVVGIDPGHNGRNYSDPAYIDRQIWNGREKEDCDTTGTETDGGYTEADFNFRVATFLAADLRRAGATVVLTRHNNHGIGPCVNKRAAILNHAHARVAIDIHADGGPPDGRGFAILEPVADGPNDHVITSSERFGRDLRHSLLAMTRMPTSTYDGVHGLTHRDDLAGLNLATEPKVLVECGNMRNATDARLLTSATFQKHAAEAMAAAIVTFLQH